ncbi:hypothetical protein O4157_14935 [Gordonia amicalis]|uniref:hypothetical protein n=1 Tax=Gordonia amicalis TaxID=89053 RepID=UPI0022B512FC|nr:hypothetical protein [Gordonia amicalis]MCZ4652720.1 hypothetical protein [Gordonia amicalis]
MPRLFADEYPDACQLPLDPTIPVIPRDGNRVGAVEIPAGWVGIVNQLHHDLVAVVGDYRVISAGDRAGALRYLVDRRSDPADALIAAAREVSKSVCTICGAPTTPANPPRCDRHPRRTTPHVIARPPPAA